MYHTRVNLALRNPEARICANCDHWHPINGNEKWGHCDVALNSGLFMNHPKGRTPYLCNHTNSRYRSQKGCKTRFVKKTTGMKIFTSYYGNYRNFKDLVPVSISIWPPRNFAGVKWARIAPTKEMLLAYKEDKNELEYKKHYWYDVLKKLDPAELYGELKRLTGGKDCVLLCFEGPDDFCHRHLFAAWMNKNGYDIRELRSDSEW